MGLLMTLLLQSGIGGSDLVPAMSSGAYDAAYNIIVLCLTQILPTLMMMTLTYTVSRGYLLSGSLQIDLGALFKLFFIAIALVSYRELAPMIGGMVGAVTDLIREPLKGKSAYDTLMLMQNAMTGTPTGPTAEEVLNGDASLTDLLTDAKQQFSQIVDALTNFSIESLLYRFVTQSTVLLVRNIMLYIRMFALGFLFCAGPISIVLSAIPPFGSLWRHWLQNYITIQLWSVTFALLDVLFNAFSDAKTIGTGGFNNVLSGQNNAEYLIACIVFIIMYFMVPSMTSWVIGSSAVQGFVGAVAGAASAVASTGVSVASPMAAGGGMADAAGRMLKRVGGGGDSGATAGAPAAPAAMSSPPPAAPSQVPTVNAAINNSVRRATV
ncbi:hypothetical protein ACFPAF_16930 [Hymenobacter endophyticus]|uniref:Conjugative transposon TraJ C-terminal domain-containing protein n=1 Tax=Hymenobacter endophyticus TaxID=3076335 RepID=A0ABU3TL30_9BACT|nr:hypothetical protein [Hymenobacter endophyticus]MDU0372089.1 hypothetical protein [Hymenobacter endophyticus]